MRTNVLAIVGFIAAFMVPVAGIVLGVMATREIAVTHEEGAGLAKAATVIGIVITATTVLFVILWLAVMFFIFSTVPFTTMRR